MAAHFGFATRTDIFLLNPASNVENPALSEIKITATNVDIPFNLQREDIQMLSGGTYTQILRPEPVEMSFSLFGWSKKFLDAIMDVDEEGTILPKRVGFLLKATLKYPSTNTGSSKSEEVILLPYGEVYEGSFFKMEAGNAQENDYGFVLDSLSIKSNGSTTTYNFSKF